MPNISTVTGQLRLIDAFTPVLQKAAAQTRASVSDMSRAAGSASQGMQRATSQISESAQSMAAAAGGAAGGVGGSFLRMGTTIGGAAAGAGVAIGGLVVVIGGLVTALKKVVDATTPVGIAMEGIQQRLIFASGSVEEANRNFEFLREVANRLGVDFMSLIQSFSNFTAAAKLSNLTAEQQRAIFLAVSEAVSTMRLSASQAEGVFLALEQMVSRGFVSMEELRRQLGNRLPGAFAIAQESMSGVTDNLVDLVSSGKLVTEDFLPGFALEMDKTFRESAVDAADSAFAAMNRFNNAILFLKADIAQEFLPELENLISGVVDLVAILGAAAEAFRLGEVIALLISKIADLALAVASIPPLFDLAAARLEGVTASVINTLEGFVRVLAEVVDRIPGLGSEAEGLRTLAGALDTASDALAGDAANRAIAAMEELSRLANGADISLDDLRKTLESLSPATGATKGEVEGLDTALAAVTDKSDILARALNRTTGMLDFHRDQMAKARKEAEAWGDRLQALADQGDPLSAALREAGEDFAFVDAVMRLGIGTAEQWEAAIKAVHDRLREFSVGQLADDVSEMVSQVEIDVQFDAQAVEAERELQQMFETVGFGFADALFAAITGQGDAVDILMNMLQNVLFDIIDNFIRNLAAQMAAAFAQQQITAAAGGAAGDASQSVSGDLIVAAIALIVIALDKADVKFNSLAVSFEEAGAILVNASTLAEKSVESLNTSEKAIFDALSQIFGSILATTGAIIGEGIEPFIFQIAEKWEDGQFIAARVLIDGVKRSFETLEEAIGVVMQSFLQHLVEQGVQLDEAVAQLATGFQGDPRQFSAALERVQSLADTALMSLDGLSQLEVEMRKLPSQLEALRNELTSLGLSADQVTRLVGGQLVASFQAWRQQITGEELSVEQRRAIAEAQRQLFNAQLELQIAQLEADKAALIASAGIAQAEVQLHSNVINAQGRFVNARAGLANAELGVMHGFVVGAGAIIRSGVELIGDTSRVLGDVLGSLPEEIRKQVEAIQKVIDALKKIGTISAGDINIPSVGTGGVGGGGGGGGGGRPSGPTLQDAIEDLIDAVMQDVEAQQALVDTLESELGGLEAFVHDLRLTGGPSPLTPGQQAEALRKQLREVATQAQMGDIESIREFQRIAAQLQQIGAEAFGTAGPGFQALLREIEFLGSDILTEGNEILEREEDILGDIRNEFADLLEITRDLTGLSQQQIDAIRAGTDSETGGNISIVQELVNSRQQTSRDIKQLREEIARLGRVIADLAA